MRIKSVFILGSTSLIAKELCLVLANKGCKRFHLIARDHKKNQDLINKLKENFNLHITEEIIDLDSSDISKVSIPHVDDYDLYLITAGSLGNNKLAERNINEAKKITNINYYSLLPWIMSITNEKRLNKKSNLWIFSSVASDRGRPSNYIYGAAKAALTNYCEGLIAKTHNKPFNIRLIKAGFILTPMSVGKAPNFLYLSPKKAVEILLRNSRKSGTEYLPWWWIIIMKVIKLLPVQFISKL